MLAARGTLNTIFSIHFFSHLGAHASAHSSVCSLTPSTDSRSFLLLWFVLRTNLRLCRPWHQRMCVFVWATFACVRVPVFVSPSPKLCTQMLCCALVLSSLSTRVGGCLMGKIYHQNVRLRIPFNRSKRRSFNIFFSTLRRWNFRIVEYVSSREDHHTYRNSDFE